MKGRGDAVGITNGYTLDGRGVEVRAPVKSKFCTSPYRPNRLWGPSSFLYNGYRGFFPVGKGTEEWN
jgi:hypothetical protein